MAGNTGQGSIFNNNNIANTNAFNIGINTNQNANNTMNLFNKNQNQGNVNNNMGGLGGLFNNPNTTNNPNSIINSNIMGNTINRVNGTMSLNYSSTPIQEQNNQTNKPDKVNLISITSLNDVISSSKHISELRYEDFLNKKNGTMPCIPSHNIISTCIIK